MHIPVLAIKSCASACQISMHLSLVIQHKTSNNAKIKEPRKAIWIWEANMTLIEHLSNDLKYLSQ